MPANSNSALRAEVSLRFRRLRQSARRAAVSALSEGLATTLRARRAERRVASALSQYLGSIERQLHPALVAEPPLHSSERRIFSQNGEDGIIMSLLENVGCPAKRFVEFGCGNGIECNTTNLAVNFGWAGLLMDGDGGNVAKARAYLANRLGDSAAKVVLANEWLTAENINDILDRYGFGENIDLLSIDVDGNDYWLWQAMRSTSARVVVIEYNASFGPQRRVTVPYDPAFDRWRKHPSGFYHGASLAALTALGRRKGYELAGCDAAGVNAFFVRSDVMSPPLRPVSPAQAWQPIRERAQVPVDEQFDRIATLPLVEIGDSA